jgi:hypothetical protein
MSDEQQPYALDVRNLDNLDDEAIWSITATACFYAGANRMLRANGLEPAPEYIDMYSTNERAPAARSSASSHTRVANI